MHIYFGGKTAVKKTLTRLVKEALEKQAGCMVLVPEMMTLETERFLLDALHLPGSFLMQVVSPSRFTERMFEQAGMGTYAGRIRVSERGRSMLVAAALMQNAEQLKYYKDVATVSGTALGIAGVLADLRRCGVTAQDLARFSESLPEGMLQDKWHDIALVGKQYEETLQDRFADGEEVQRALCSRLMQTDVLEGMHIIVYGFDLVTEPMAGMICSMTRAAQVSVLIKADAHDEAFSPLTDSVLRLQMRASAAYRHVQVTELEEETEPGIAPELAHLRAYYTKGTVYPREDSGAVRFTLSATPYDELTDIARTVRDLHDSGLPYSRMALVLCAKDAYFTPVMSVFRLMDIPVYVPRKTACATHSLGRFILCSLKAAASGFAARYMQSLLSGSFLSITRDEAVLLSNYIENYGIDHGLFLKPFTRGGEAVCAEMEPLRQRFTEPLERLASGLKNAAGTKQALCVILDYMDELHCYESLESTEEKLLSEGLEEQAAVNRQVWNSVMGLMDEMVALFGDSEERLGAKRAVSIFRAGLEEALLSPLPPKAGSMMCGGVGDIADGDYDVVFLAGLTDATLQVAPDPFVDDDERRALNEQTRRFVGLDDAGRDRKMKLDLYAALCMPTRRLYVSMVNTEQNGETRRPHLFYQELRYMFPACAETGGVLRRSLSDRPLSLTHAAAEYASRFASDQVNEVWQSAWRRICREVPETAARVQSVFVRSRDRGTVSREASAGLFRENVMSVSRLETFAACPFRHFVRYGLRPDEPRGWRVNPADTGSFYHEALDGITKLLPSIPNWPDVRKRECDALVDQVAAEYEEKIYGPLMQDSFRARAAVQDYRRLLKRVLWSFTKGACNSAFRIMGSELHFGDGTDGALPAVPLQLPDGQRVMLRGVIDRVDRYDSETGESYYRVVDYKSGDQSLEARRIYYGEQLQLLMYLRAVSGADGIPAGAYYYHLEDSLVEEPEDPAMLEQLLAETLKLKGITLRDAKIIRLMDGGKPPVSMPQLLNKDGSIAKKSSTFLLNEMYELMRFAVQKAVSLCEDMRRGSVRPRQVVGTGRSACETCDYADICRRENRRQVAEEKMTMQDLIELAAEPQE